MQRADRVRSTTVLTLLATAFAVVAAGPVAAAKKAGLGHDYRTFHADGRIVYGRIADSYKADLVMYLAGNQFMVMEDLMRDFQKKHPEIRTIYVETIPPGQILKQQILRQGTINGRRTSRTPDLFASVNLGHLKTLRGKGIMHDYMIYTHNKLELMVATGNPKGIQGPKDLARKDVVLSLPNPLTEGIFKFYGSKMLKQAGIYQQVTHDKKCKSCWAIRGKTWFTSRHHRETPYRIERGQADAGIVWATEVVYGKRSGRKIDGVPIPAPYNMADQVGYAIGPLVKARNPRNARRFLEYLQSASAQDIYTQHGFVRASAAELELRAIPHATGS